MRRNYCCQVLSGTVQHVLQEYSREKPRKDCEPTCTSSPCPTLGLLVAELLSQGAERDTRRPLSASRERTPLNWTPTHLRPRLNFCCEESGIQVVVENHGLRGSPAGRPSGSSDGLCPARPISFSHPWPERALKRAYSCDKNYQLLF